MTDYRIELQAFVDAAASFTEPALGHHKAWAEAVARARVALSMPESSASTVCPITPPPELVQQWVANATGPDYEQVIATQAARWAADMELEACCEWMVEMDLAASGDIEQLRSERRPKPPSLKEQALDILQYPKDFWSEGEVDTIRRALEQLND